MFMNMASRPPIQHPAGVRHGAGHALLRQELHRAAPRP